MILLAESSSTRTEWNLLDNNGIVESFISDGINPFFQTRKDINHIIRLQLPSQFFSTKINKIYFYGEGCTTIDRRSVVKASLETQFKTPSEIETNLLGAARSLFNNSAGIACILGTDANTCFYDGTSIVKSIESLGYLLGDEGSGASLGRIFLSDCLKGIAPKELIEPFYSKYKINPSEVLDYFYKTPFPNKLLSIMSFFLYEHIEHPYVSEIVHKEMRAFFTRNIFQYEYTDYPIRFVGTFAKMYSFVLRQVAQSLGIYIDIIIENSTTGLVEYHLEHSFGRSKILSHNS